jgi:acetyl esterase/lipase
MRSVHSSDAHSAFPFGGGRARPCPSMTQPSPSLPHRVRRVAEVHLRGRRGRLPARAYWPAETGTAPLPLLVLLPPGTGDGGEADALARGLCSLVGIVVLAVEATAAGPAGPALDGAVEDATTAAGWAADHASDLGADHHRFLVGGEGAGADLAATVARHARDRGWPPILRQVLVRPDLGRSTLAAGSLAGGAPATVLVAPGDGDAPADRLRRAGVDVQELVVGDAAGPGLGDLASSLRRTLDAAATAPRPARDGST